MEGSDRFIVEWCFVLDYASDVVSGPWPELEAVILDHGCLPTYGVSYAIDGRKSRFRALEERMLGPRYGSPVYDQITEIVLYAAVLFEGHPWPEAERFFIEDLGQRSPRAAASAASSYAKSVVRGRWEAGEPLLSGSTLDMYWYARHALKQPLPDPLHSEMVMMSFRTPDDSHIKDYFKWCDEWAAAPRGEAP